MRIEFQNRFLRGGWQKTSEGLKPLRVRSQQGLMAVATFVNMANLLLEIVGIQKTKIKENHYIQLELELAA